MFHSENYTNKTFTQSNIMPHRSFSCDPCYADRLNSSLKIIVNGDNVTHALHLSDRDYTSHTNAYTTITVIYFALILFCFCKFTF